MSQSKQRVHELTPDQIEKYFVPLLPKNKRGFPSKIPVLFVFQCIQHKLRTGCQWKDLFLESQYISYPCSWQSIFYFFNRWSKLGVFEQAFENLLRDQLPSKPVRELSLDGTHSPAKKGVQQSLIKRVKRPALVRNSNLLISTADRYS